MPSIKELFYIVVEHGGLTGATRQPHTPFAKTSRKPLGYAKRESLHSAPGGRSRTFSTPQPGYKMGGATQVNPAHTAFSVYRYSYVTIWPPMVIRWKPLFVLVESCFQLIHAVYSIFFCPTHKMVSVVRHDSIMRIKRGGV